ncbi:MAG: AAA family ATPase [Gemmatimonadetes bacterium]|nr:AAA family ATPase [Gemmatimonadota bacterium]
MSPVDPLKDLEVLIRSRYGLIGLETEEEDRAATLLRHLADRLSLAFFLWSRSKGLMRADRENAIYNTATPAAVLDHLAASELPAVYLLEGFASFLTDELVTAKLKDVARRFEQRDGAIVVTGQPIVFPEPLRPRVALVRLPPPGPGEFRSLLLRILRDLKARNLVSVELKPDELRGLIQNLRGLTLMEAEKILTKLMVEDGKLSEADLRNIVAAKKEIVEREGLLEYYPLEESLEDVADLAGLKAWLRKRRAILAEPERAAEFGLEFPKGLLLVGVPGCGKSLCAKAVASEWGIPLLKLDPSSLYNKYVGESEKNFKRAMAISERVAPVVLWIDEIEKAFAAAGTAEDGGLSLRILGTFLSWLQDRRGDVFVMATANDVSRLPPELLRKGRFDEIFFVDLPDAETRRAIFEIHLRKRGQEPGSFDLFSLVAATETFTGADIEQVVISALYTAFSEGKALATAGLLEETARTKPLSETMPERISALRAWAEGRTVRAQ